MLRIEQLKVRYKDKLALDSDQSLEILEGDRVGIIGSNGAGKTTLLKAILGMVPYEGDIHCDIPPAAMAVHMQQNEYSETVPVRVVMEAVLGCALKSHPLAGEMIDFFEFAGCLNKRWKQLSGGQKQRLTLILVLCQESPLTMMDEVTSGLDFETRQRLVDRLVSWYRQRGGTLLITSHYYAELDNLATKVLLLDAGHVVDYGEKDALFRKYCGSSVVVAKAEGDLGDWTRAFRSLVAGPGSLAFSCQNEEEEIEVMRQLCRRDINFTRSSNDIEIMSLCAKASYYGGQNHG